MHDASHRVSGEVAGVLVFASPIDLPHQAGVSPARGSQYLANALHAVSKMLRLSDRADLEAGFSDCSARATRSRCPGRGDLRPPASSQSRDRSTDPSSLASTPGIVVLPVDDMTTPRSATIAWPKRKSAYGSAGGRLERPQWARSCRSCRPADGGRVPSKFRKGRMRSS